MAGLPCGIAEETQRSQAELTAGVKGEPEESNACYFHVAPGFPFKGGTFKLELFLPEEHPMAAPKVNFMTKISHPYVDNLGRICLDILKAKWSPALEIQTVLLLFQAVLSAPNPDNQLANDVGESGRPTKPKPQKQVDMDEATCHGDYLN